MYKLRMIDNLLGPKSYETVRYGIPTRGRAETIEKRCNASRSQARRQQCEYVALPMTEAEIMAWDNTRKRDKKLQSLMNWKKRRNKKS